MKPRDETFDGATHTYRIDGRVVPSVSQIVRRFLPFGWEIDPWYLERGTMVHRAVALLVHGRLDWDSVDPRIVGYVRAAATYMTQPCFQGVEMAVEVPLFSGCGQFAGTPDLVLQRTIIDFKTGAAEPATEIQLGGYACLVGQDRHQVCAAHLAEDGTFTMTWYSARRCRGLFLAALSLYQWYEKNGLNPKKGDGDGDEH